MGPLEGHRNLSGFVVHLEVQGNDNPNMAGTHNPVLLRPGDFNLAYTYSYDLL